MFVMIHAVPLSKVSFEYMVTDDQFIVIILY